MTLCSTPPVCIVPSSLLRVITLPPRPLIKMTLLHGLSNFIIRAYSARYVAYGMRWPTIRHHTKSLFIDVAYSSR